MSKVNASAQWTDGERFVADAASGHAMIVDADRKRNSGTGPMELVLMGLCCCTATDVVSILTKKRQPFSALMVHAEAERAEDPPTIYKSIHLVYRVGGGVDHKAMEDAVRLSKDKYCSVSQMLQKSATITSSIEYLG